MLETRKAPFTTNVKAMEMTPMAAEIGNQQETGVADVDLGYLAAMIDGEGRIGMSMGLNGLQCAVVINNTNSANIEKCVRIYEALGINPHIYSEAGDDR